MKIIVNSAYLKKGLDNALNNMPLEAIINSERIFFRGHKASFDVDIHKEAVRDPEEFKVKFDFLQWQKVLKLLKLIPEQPIILDLCDNSEDGLRIEINGMCAIF